MDVARRSSDRPNSRVIDEFAGVRIQYVNDGSTYHPSESNNRENRDRSLVHTSLSCACVIKDLLTPPSVGVTWMRATRSIDGSVAVDSMPTCAACRAREAVVFCKADGACACECACACERACACETPNGTSRTGKAECDVCAKRLTRMPRWGTESRWERVDAYAMVTRAWTDDACVCRASCRSV